MAAIKKRKKYKHIYKRVKRMHKQARETADFLRDHAGSTLDYKQVEAEKELEVLGRILKR